MALQPRTLHDITNNRRQRTDSLASIKSHVNENKVRKVSLLPRVLRSNFDRRCLTESMMNDSSELAVLPDKVPIVRIDKSCLDMYTTIDKKLNIFREDLLGYQEQIYVTFYRQDQRRINKANVDYLSQSEIPDHNKMLLISWLFEVQQFYSIRTESLHLACMIAERYLFENTIKLENLQLLYATSMFIAEKYVERFSQGAQTYVNLTDKSYSKKEILDFERTLLSAIDFEVAFPTPTAVLPFFLFACDDIPTSEKVILELISMYLNDLILLYNLATGYSCFERIAAALFLSRRIVLNSDNVEVIWPSALSEKLWLNSITRVEMYRVIELVEMYSLILDKLYPSYQVGPDSELKIDPHQKAKMIYYKSVVVKYSDKRYRSISKHDSLLEFDYNRFLIYEIVKLKIHFGNDFKIFL